MDLENKLKSRINKLEIEGLIQSFNHKKFSLKEIIALLKKEETQFQASWLMTHLIERKPAIVDQDDVLIFVELLESDILEGVERNIWRSLSFIKIPEIHHESLINIAFEKLENHKTAVAVQAFSMTVLEKLLINEPELQQALKEILMLKLEQQPSAGIRSCATKIIGKIN